MTRLHLQIRSTSTEIQNAITQMQSKLHMQAHVSIFWPQHFCFIIYKSAIVLNECKVTHCSGAFLLFHDYTASTHRRRRKGTEVENPQKKISNKLQIMIRSLTLQRKLLNLPLIPAAAFRGTFLQLHR